MEMQNQLIHSQFWHNMTNHIQFCENILRESLEAFLNVEKINSEI